MSNQRHWPTLVGITWKGTWDEAITYTSRDAVRYGGATFYLGLGPSVGQLPSDGSPWELMTDAGAESIGQGHIIRDHLNADYPMREKLKFAGGAAAESAQVVVTDNAAGSVTVVALPPPFVPTQEAVEEIIGTTIDFADLELTGAFTNTFPGTDPPDPLIPADHAQVALDKGGVTHLRGQVHCESGGEQIVCTLPGIFWPTNEVVSPCVDANGTVTEVKINPVGEVRLNRPSGHDIHLDGVAFPSDLAFGGVPKGVPPIEYIYGGGSEGVPPLLVYHGSDTRKTILIGGVSVGDPMDNLEYAFTIPRLPGEVGTFVGTVYWTAPGFDPDSGGPTTPDAGTSARATPLETHDPVTSEVLPIWTINMSSPAAWPTTGVTFNFVLRGRII